MNHFIEYPFPTQLNFHEKHIVPEDYKESAEILWKAFSFIDLTSLNTDDNQEKITAFCKNINDFISEFPTKPSVAAFCCFPNFAKTAKKYLKTVPVAAVSASFPSSQSFFEIKKRETELAIEKGADEIDIVIPVGFIREKNWTKILAEISELKAVCGKKKLKVILETGILSDEEIWYASIISMKAGADFIKTSTGKLQPAATPVAVKIMCTAISQFNKKEYRIVGIKPSGGISTTDDALVYYKIVEDILGTEWLKSQRFRIGASRLANNILADIAKIEGFNARKFF